MLRKKNKKKYLFSKISFNEDIKKVKKNAYFIKKNTFLINRVKQIDSIFIRNITMYENSYILNILLLHIMFLYFSLSIKSPLSIIFTFFSSGCLLDFINIKNAYFYVILEVGLLILIFVNLFIF